MMNYVVTAIFVGSIAYVFMYYKNNLTQQNDSVSPLTNALFPIMVLWCACLAYFFGFFGISFLDTDALSSSPSSFGLDDMRRQAEDFEQATHDEKTRKPTPVVQKKPEIKHIARNDTPICAERAVTVRSSDAIMPVGHVDAEDIDFENLADEEVLGHLIAGLFEKSCFKNIPNIFLFFSSKI
jgi:hypothetical protein